MSPHTLTPGQRAALTTGRQVLRDYDDDHLFERNDANWWAGTLATVLEVVLEAFAGDGAS